MNNLNILVANDIESRTIELEKFIYKCSDDYEVVKTYSYKDTVREINKKKYDFIILDVTMPTYFNSEKFSSEAGTFRSLAGINILERMSIEKINTPTVLFTGIGRFYDKYNYLITIDDIKANIVEYDFCKEIITDYGEENIWQNKIRYYLKDIKNGKKQIANIVNR